MGAIRNSTKAVILYDGRVLLTRNRDQWGDFYLFPGGGQEFGEVLKDAVFRECMEEIGAEVIVGDLLHVREYIGKNHEFAEWDSGAHQVEFYFECRLKDPGADTSQGVNPDSYQTGAEWVELERLDHIRLYPKTVGEVLRNKANAGRYLGDVN
ncbi:MAG: hydrolase [Paenibacillaceae bacterium]|jgi:ADP-ribose pyrophosphatase YjhB (NUDIX family)|nr:hydrolase [Paenibacillaceae bacterium]